MSDLFDRELLDEDFFVREASCMRHLLIILECPVDGVADGEGICQDLHLLDIRSSVLVLSNRNNAGLLCIQQAISMASGLGCQILHIFDASTDNRNTCLHKAVLALHAIVP